MNKTATPELEKNGSEGGVINTPETDSLGSGNVTMLEAINKALRRLMREDPKVVLLGVDIGKNGGVFRVTEELWKEFGDKRVKDTPLSELGIVSFAIGLALGGFKPGAESQFSGFIYNALEQIISHAARWRSRTEGRLTCPIVIRMPWAGRIDAPEHHSENNEACFTNIPAVKTVVPATAEAAYRLTLAAFRDPDPVIMLEPIKLYRSVKGDFEDDGKEAPLGKCRKAKNGDDITLISWGHTIYECLDAATMVASEGISVEVIDVQTLSPLDIDTIVKSVKKTGRFAVVHDAPMFSGFGAEITAQIYERANEYIVGPSKRIAGLNVTLPLFRREKYTLPDSLSIALDVRSLVTSEFAHELPHAELLGIAP